MRNIWRRKEVNEMEIECEKIKLCPLCNRELIERCMYWCFNCKKWFEDIDFLDLEVKIDEDCKKCEWLVETEFKKNDLTLFYCNNTKADRKVEKIRDFRKCNEFKETIGEKK